jgi:threonine dehydrogenase-like Zn-dependent dehydrogenase
MSDLAPAVANHQASQLASHRVVWAAKNEVRLQSFGLPPTAPDQILVEAEVSLISRGTEVAFLAGAPNTPNRYPRYPGYSLVGIVTEVGAAVIHFSVGARVAAPAPHQSHFLGVPQHCFPVPQDVSADEAVFFNLIAMVSQGVRRLDVEIGDSAVVFGTGLVGCLAIKMLRLCGSMPIVAVIRRRERLSAAAAAGADAVVVSDGECAATFSQLTGRPGASVAIDATDDPEVAVRACRATLPGGRVLLLGSARGSAAEVNFYEDIYRRGLTIVGGHASVGPKHDSSVGWWTRQDECRLAIGLLRHRRLSVDDLITDRFSWTQATRAYHEISQRSSLALGTILDWRTPQTESQQ